MHLGPCMAYRYCFTVVTILAVNFVRFLLGIMSPFDFPLPAHSEFFSILYEQWLPTPTPTFYFKMIISFDLMLSHIWTVVVCLH